MRRYNKIVRDKIPDSIQEQGKTFSLDSVKDKDAIKFLIQKLHEEADELKKSFNEEELADVLEVVDALIEKSEFDKKEILRIKDEKKKSNGGFEKNLILKSVS